MFDIGFSELVVIGLIALIVLGPKRLPEVARMAGKWMGQLRRFISNVKQDLDREIHQDELADLHKLREELNGTRRLMENTSGELVRGFTEVTPAAVPNTIHSGDNPKREQAGSPKPAPVKRPRVKSTKKSRSEKPHGGTRKNRHS